MKTSVYGGFQNSLRIYSLKDIKVSYKINTKLELIQNKPQQALTFSKKLDVTCQVILLFLISNRNINQRKSQTGNPLMDTLMEYIFKYILRSNTAWITHKHLVNLSVSGAETSVIQQYPKSR